MRMISVAVLLTTVLLLEGTQMKQLSMRVISVAVLLTTVLLPAGCSSAEASVEFYMSPTGDDRNSGTKQEPFASLTRARNAVREENRTGQKADITVFLRGGTYELKEPLVLGPEDSGTDKFSVTYRAYPGEKPIISGGRRITGWKPGPAKMWQAELPEVKSQRWYFRQLFIDGKRATRARTPNADSKTPYLKVKDAELKEEEGIWRVELAPGEVRNWNNLPDVEIVIRGLWAIIRKNLASIDQGKGEVILAPPHVSTHFHDPKSGRWVFFENAMEMLDQPGEWYLDRSSGKLYYWPLAGEDMSKIEVVAPVLDQLLEIAGTDEQLVRNVHFKGLSFQHAQWPWPPWGFAGDQAGAMYAPEPEGFGFVGEAILWRFADSCSLTNCEITQVGGCGISLQRGCTRSVIEGNHVHDIGSNGINVGENLVTFYDKALEQLLDKDGFDLRPGVTPNYHPPPQEVPRGNRIANNHIHACGVDYYGSVGIYVAYTNGTVVSHNLLHDLPYTGISCGFFWGVAPTVCRNNVVEYNHIYDVMKMMDDGAGIYTLGSQPGTVIRGNVVHDVRRNPFAFAPAILRAGLYFDNGSSEMVVEGNTVYGLALPDSPSAFPVFLGWRTRNIVFRNNVIVQAGGKAFCGARPPFLEGKDKKLFKFENNKTPAAEGWKPPPGLRTRVGLEAAYRKMLLGQ